MIPDPYRILDVSPDAPEAELLDAYRRAVKRHHPDHNGGSPESARRFEEVQEAWAEIRRRRSGGGAQTHTPAGSRPSTGGWPPAAEPDLEDRLRTMEAELRQARSSREAAAEVARRAAAQAAQEAAKDAVREPPASTGDDDRPSDEELGYIRTDDSLTKILADARDGLLGSLDDKPARQRAADVLEEVAAMLRGDQPPRGRREH